jgi:hypothetical protein
MVTSRVTFPTNWQTVFPKNSFYGQIAHNKADFWFQIYTTHIDTSDADAKRVSDCILYGHPIEARGVKEAFIRVSNKAIERDSHFRDIAVMLSGAAKRFQELRDGETDDAKRFGKVMPASKFFKNGVSLKGVDFDRLAGILPSYPEGAAELYDLAYRIYLHYMGTSNDQMLDHFGRVVERFEKGATAVYELGNLMVKEIGKRYQYALMGEDAVYTDDDPLMDDYPLMDVEYIKDNPCLDFERSSFATDVELSEDEMPELNAFRALLTKYTGDAHTDGQISLLKGMLKKPIPSELWLNYSQLNLPALLAMRALVSEIGVQDMSLLEGVISTLESVREEANIIGVDEKRGVHNSIQQGLWISQAERSQIDDAIEQFTELMR